MIFGNRIFEKYLGGESRDLRTMTDADVRRCLQGLQLIFHLSLPIAFSFACLFPAGERMVAMLNLKEIVFTKS